MNKTLMQTTLTGGKPFEVPETLPYIKSLASPIYRRTQARAKKVSYISWMN